MGRVGLRKGPQEQAVPEGKVWAEFCYLGDFLANEAKPQESAFVFVGFKTAIPITGDVSED